jgi:hypothetical protein
MAAQLRYQVPVDTGHFSPHQVHPRGALRLAFGSISQCVNGQIMPWPELISSRHWSFVAVGFDMQYLAPLTFENAGTMLEVGGRLFLRGGGSLVEHRCTIGGDGAAAPPEPLRVTTLWRPVRLTGSSEAAGLPQPADEWLASHFGEDARIASKPERLLPGELERLKQYEPVGEHDHVMTVSRDECEFVDQWLFTSLATYCARSREALIFESESSAIRGALRRPMTRLVSELKGPLYFASRLRVRSRALVGEAGLAFVHEGFDASFAAHERPSFTAVEWFGR